jgi:hypothetical protein
MFFPPRLPVLTHRLALYPLSPSLLKSLVVSGIALYAIGYVGMIFELDPIKLNRSYRVTVLGLHLEMRSVLWISLIFSGLLINSYSLAHLARIYNRRFPEDYPLHDQENFKVIDLREVKRAPLIYLNEIHQSGWPQQIILSGGIERRAYDMGGVSKAFLNTLIKALRTSAAFTVDSIDLPYLKERHSIEEKLLWRHLGSLYGHLILRNRYRSDRFSTGECVHPDYLKLVAIAQEPHPIQPAAKFLADRIAGVAKMPYELIQFSFDCKTLQPVRRQLLRAYCEALGESEESGGLIALEEVKKYLRAAHEFWLGLPLQLQREIALRQHDLTWLKTLLKSVQGERADPRRLLASLHIDDPSGRIQQPAGWLRERISSEDRGWLERFTAAVTGQRSLNGSRITIRPGLQGFFRIATCSNVLEIPVSSWIKEEFYAALDSIIYNKNFNAI